MRIIAAFIVLLIFGSCSSDTPKSTQSNITGTTQSVPKYKIVIANASALSPLIGTWEADAVVGIKKTEERLNYEGMWFDLSADQSFSFGQYESQTHIGQYNFDEEEFIITFFFDPADQKIAHQYKIQGLGGSDGATLIWKGNTPENPKGMQLKMIKVNREPVQ